MTEPSREGDTGGTGKCSILEIQLQNWPGMLCCNKYDCTIVSLREIVALDIVLDPIFHFTWICVQVSPFQILYDYLIKANALRLSSIFCHSLYMYVFYMYFVFM